MLYETVTGRKAFEGKTQASLIAAIMDVDPPAISTFQPLTPAWLDRIVKKCLEKDPQERWQSAKDLLDVLRWSAGGDLVDRESDAKSSRPRGALVAWAVAAAAIVTAVTLAIPRVLQPSPTPVALVRFTVSPPPDTSFVATVSSSPVNQPTQVVSPDGRQLAFLARRGADPTSIWIRSLQSLDARRLAGTEGASLPFWSADSQSIGFFAAGKLKRIEAAGGAAQTLCDAPQGAGGTWNREGTILFAPTSNSALYRVSAAGGEPTIVTSLDLPSGKVASERWPAFLPDGRHFYFSSRPATCSSVRSIRKT